MSINDAQSRGNEGYIVTFNAQIGARLKEARKKLGWTQQQAADAAGVRREMWARYEAGAKLGAGAMAALAKAGADLRYILVGDEHEEPPISPAQLVEQLHSEMRERLRAQLQRRGTSVAQAARDAGMPSAQGLRDVLAGRKRISAEMLEQLLKIGVDIMYVLTGRYAVHEIPPLEPREAALLSNWRTASDDGKRAIEGTAVFAAHEGAARGQGRRRA